MRTPELVELMIRDRIGERVDRKTFEQALGDGVRDVVRHQAEVGIDIVLQAGAQAYSFEACNPHEHEFRIWGDVTLPEDKILIPGVIGHATNVVEHPELVAMRISNFEERVGR